VVANVELDRMTVAEKIQLLERVWDNLCREPGDFTSPEWHEEVLRERKRRLETGEASLSTWAEAKARLMKLGQ
jgi:putative addiction module component (TIGR02574 family)